MSAENMTEIECVTGNRKMCSAVSLGTFNDQSGRHVPQEVLRCQLCGHGVTKPPLSDVPSLYVGRQSQDFQSNSRGLGRLIKELAFRIQARHLLHQLVDRPSTLLDYGCGSGQFTRILGDLLPDAVVTGSDFFDTPPPELAGRRYVSFSQTEESEVGFDVVIALHVLEHDNSPREFLRRIISLVRPGGKLIVEVPNIDCPWGRILGRYWDVWYLPFHRHHFSRSSLLAILESEGLVAEVLLGVTVPSMGRTLANFLRLPKNIFCLIAGIALHPIQIAGEFISAQPTALRVIVRKPPSRGDPNH